MTTCSDIVHEIIHAKEDEHLECKEAKEQFDFSQLCKYCVAIGNELGGRLVLGVSDDVPRKIVGTNAFLDTQKIREQLFLKLKFRVCVEEIICNGKRILIFSIPSRPKGHPFSYDGMYFMRVGEKTVTMSEDKMRSIFLENRKNFLLEYALENVDEKCIEDYLDTNAYFEISGLPLPTTRNALLSKFESEQLIEKKSLWNITNLGACLFAKDFNCFKNLTRKAPRVTTYPESDRMFPIRDIVFTKGYISGFAELLSYVNSQIPTFETIGQAFRTEKNPYPEIAVRELVANALVHQDIEDIGSFITIEIFRDRMEIANPGTPLISVDRFIDEYKSRNELMTDIMRRFKICEERSSGIDKVVSLAEKYFLPAPDFRAGETRTSAILFTHKSFDDMDRDERMRACYQHACLCQVSNRKMTNQSLRERFGLSPHRADVVSRIIADVVGEGKIKIDNPQSRSRRYAKYVPHLA